MAKNVLWPPENKTKKRKKKRKRELVSERKRERAREREGEGKKHLFKQTECMTLKSVPMWPNK